LRKDTNFSTLKLEPQKKEAIIQHEKNMPFQKILIADSEIAVSKGSLKEKNSKLLQNEKLQINEEDSLVLNREGNKKTTKTNETMFQCELCARQGKLMVSKLVGIVSWNPNKIKWEKAEGFKGEYERSEDVNNPEFKVMLKDLAQHGGKLTKDGYFYWVFKNGSTVGRKRR